MKEVDKRRLSPIVNARPILSESDGDRCDALSKSATLTRSLGDQLLYGGAAMRLSSMFCAAAALALLIGLSGARRRRVRLADAPDSGLEHRDIHDAHLGPFNTVPVLMDRSVRPQSDRDAPNSLRDLLAEMACGSRG